MVMTGRWHVAVITYAPLCGATQYRTRKVSAYLLSGLIHHSILL